MFNATIGVQSAKSKLREALIYRQPVCGVSSKAQDLLFTPNFENKLQEQSQLLCVNFTWILIKKSKQLKKTPFETIWIIPILMIFLMRLRDGFILFCLFLV